MPKSFEKNVRERFFPRKIFEKNSYSSKSVRPLNCFRGHWNWMIKIG